MFDRELLFQLLYKKEWEHLSEQLYIHRSLLKKDVILQQAANLFESEFLDYLRNLTDLEKVKSTRHISLVIASERENFKESFWRPLIEIKLQAMYEIKDKSLPSAASEWVNEISLARELLIRIQKERPEELADARRSTLHIKASTQADTVLPVQYVTSIFRSPQERNFYLAMTDVAPNFIPYPNFAMSAALNFSALENKISAAAKKFFFNSQFDCVVVDPNNDYRPIHFFELDSKFHDTDEAKNRDRLKDEICAKAGIKLLRIRAFKQQETTREAFAQLIREILVTTSNKS